MMSTKQYTSLHTQTNPTLRAYHKKANIFWSPFGYSFRKRAKRHNKIRAFVLFVFAFFTSSCLVYHFITYEYRIHKILDFCNKKPGDLKVMRFMKNINNYNDSIINGDNTQNASENHLIGTSKRLPKCIIIGVRKCGTRALLEFLNIHPSVQKASDEVHFFDDDSKYMLGLEWYRSQMPYSFAEQLTIEKSPAYFITDSVPKRIYSMETSIKLILIVRDPVTRLISDYAQLAANKAKKDRRMASFEDLVLLPNGQVNTSYKAVRIGIYAFFYMRWIKVFPKQQVYIVDGDRLVYDPFPEVQRVEQFLGLTHHISRDNFSYNSTKGFFCIKQSGPTEKCLNESKGRRHPEINPIVVQTLRKFYSPYNRQFYRLAGKDYGWPEY